MAAEKNIQIKGARVHNLKNIDVTIPRNKLVVITGLSGSGKSSLAFNTLFAEGQRRYVESLSSYARQFLGKIEKPDVDYIKGISPAIAIEQKVNSSNTRSTVGTTTEIADYLKLLFARIGKTYSPKTGKEVKRDSIADISEFLMNLPVDSTAFILSKLKTEGNRKIQDELALLIQQGYSRVFVNNQLEWIEELLKSKQINEPIYLMIDRFQLHNDIEKEKSRITESIETALFEGKSKCSIAWTINKNVEFKHFNHLFEEAGEEFMEPSVHFFSFNNPLGACPKCEGFGKVIGIDEDLVIPNKSLSIYQDAIACWKGEKMQEWKNKLISKAEQFDLPIHKPIFDFTEEQYALLWNGNKQIKGLNYFFDYLASKSYKIQYRILLARYRGRTICPDCKGSRLRKETDNVKISGKSINELSRISLTELAKYFKEIKLNKRETTISKRILAEIINRIQYLNDVGVSYLNLNRSSATLSGGESQRINLASSLGSSLVGSLYILDEPSIGLHPKDTERLIKILKSLRDLGNTVIIVEHDEEIMRSADHIIDLGPYAGHEGGELVFSGTPKEILKSDTLTAQYLKGTLNFNYPKVTKKLNNTIRVIGARENNLKNINVEFPLNAMTVISGVSGSGKSTLVKKIIYPGLQKILGGYGEKTGLHEKIEGEIDLIKEIQFIDQNPIGRSSRSNPVTYIKAYDEIRALFANLGLSKSRGYKPAHYSFNVEGGRCETCLGEGEITEEMQFMADIHLTCDACGGKRFKDEILEVQFQGKNIYDILELTIDEAVQFFSENKLAQSQKVAEKLEPLLSVGLGYVKLGQASGTLSGGEAQRIKLASYLGKGSSKNHILFIFDEPTTGLHFHDISKLLISFNALIEKGHSLLVIEHNPEIIKQADWLIDLGPEGGDFGGELLFQGPPDQIKKSQRSYTANYI